MNQRQSSTRGCSNSAIHHYRRLAFRVNEEQNLVELNGRSVLNTDLHNFTRNFGLNFVKQFHCLDNTNDRAFFDHVAHFGVSWFVQSRRTVESPDYR